MPWWVWLVGWLVLSAMTAVWLGAAAAIARRREYPARDRDPDAEVRERRPWWSLAG